jgi:glycosyltransferase involved in cell wall biosynthesis
MIESILMVDEFYSHGDGSSLYQIDVGKRLQNLGFKVSILFGTQRDKKAYNPDIESFFMPDLFGFNYSYPTGSNKKIKEIVNHVNPQIIYIHQVLNPHVISLLATLKPSIRYEHGFRLSCFTGRRLARRTNTICNYSPGLSCLVRAHTQLCSPRNPLLAIKRIKDFYLNKFAHQKLKYILVASKYIKSLLIKSGYKDNFVKILPYYTNLPGLESIADSKATPTIVCVSRVEAEKGVDYLLRALSRVKTKAKVFIIGEGTEIPRLKKMSRSLSDKHEIVFTGWIENSEIKKYYSNATLAVVPSIWPEPFGIIGIEAMANAVPVVAFNVGGISDWLIDGENGYLVPRKDEEVLAKKISYYLENPEIAKSMGMQGRSLAEKKFVLDVHLNKLVNLFERAVQ